MTTDDPISVIHSIDAKWNAHDEEAVLQHLSDDVVIRLSPPPRRRCVRSAPARSRRENSSVLSCPASTSHPATTRPRVMWSPGILRSHPMHSG